MKINDDTKELIVNILFSLVVALIGYSVQFIVFVSVFSQFSNISNSGFRAIRMLLGYVVIPIYFLRKHHQKIKDMGFHIKSKISFIMAFILGIIMYLIAAIVFVRYQIFTQQWTHRDVTETIVIFLMIAVMASVTDLWTRGFVLIQVNQLYGKYYAIVVQNSLWFILHIYEILLLVPYIGWFGSITLTLFLGIAGDLITLHYENITGLMVGHIILNLCIVLAGRGLIQI